MKSDRAPASGTPSPSTDGPSRSLRNRFSNFSLLSLSSIRTLLPQYSATDNLDGPSPDASSRPPSRNTQTSSSDPRFRHDTSEPPSYTSVTSVEGEFRYSFPIRPKKPWATLHLRTRDAVPGNIKPLLTQTRVPRVWSCDPITGTLELDLDSPQAIQQIGISLTGNVASAATPQGFLQFLLSEFTLWDKSMGKPRCSANADANATSQKADGRFGPGKYNFHFSFPFPTYANAIKEDPTPRASISPFPTIAVGSFRNISSFSSHVFPLNDTPSNPEAEKGSLWVSRPTTSGLPSHTGPEAIASSPASPAGQSHLSLACPLPQSFMEKGVNSNVSYDLLVRIDHGRFRGSSKIRTNIIYFPASRSHLLPSRRREAYESGGLLPCPMDDPEGWLSWPALTIYGMVDSDSKPRRTKAECMLHLARPLSYPRGSVIPCFLTISSEDETIVRLLSDQRAPTLRLLRCIEHPIVGEHTKSTFEQQSAGLRKFAGFSSVVEVGTFTVPTGKMASVNHEVGRAQWWVPPNSFVQHPNIRHLEGEIHLSQSLPPSCDFQFFRVQYFVELLPFRAVSFVPEVHSSLNQECTVLAWNPIAITTLVQEDEPVPIVFSEPPKTTFMRRVDTGGKWGGIVEEE